MHEISPRIQGSALGGEFGARARASHIETRVVVIPRDVKRSDAARMLADEAEHGKWELARTVIYQGGLRKVWLKRRSMRIQRSS